MAKKHFWQTTSPYPMYAFLALTVSAGVCAVVDFLEHRLGLALFGTILLFVFALLATYYRPEPPPDTETLDAVTQSRKRKVLVNPSDDAKEARTKGDNSDFN